jgi:hypothetical protein
MLLLFCVNTEAMASAARATAALNAALSSNGDVPPEAATTGTAGAGTLGTASASTGAAGAAATATALTATATTAAEADKVAAAKAKAELWRSKLTMEQQRVCEVKIALLYSNLP